LAKGFSKLFLWQLGKMGVKYIKVNFPKTLEGSLPPMPRHSFVPTSHGGQH